MELDALRPGGMFFPGRLQEEYELLVEVLVKQMSVLRTHLCYLYSLCLFVPSQSASSKALAQDLGADRGVFPETSELDGDLLL